MGRKTRNDWRAEHLINLYTEHCGDGPQLGAEIGVWEGELSRRLLAGMPELALILVDPYKVYDDKYIGTEQARIDNAKRLAIAATSENVERTIWLEMESKDAAVMIDGECLDWVFIDACHKYEAVYADLRLLWPKVKSGGIFSGHDYNGKGDKRGEFGVKRAVDEWAADLGLEVHEEPQLVWWVKKP